jgi:hypothetical protein
MPKWLSKKSFCWSLVLQKMAQKSTVRPPGPSRLISDLTLKILKIFIIIANLVVNILPCKWNFKKQKFTRDKSQFNFLCRSLHFLGRIAAILYVLVYLTWFYDSAEFESWDFIASLIIMFWCLASVAIFVLTFKRPYLLPALFNRILSINRQFGEKFRF